MDEGVGSVRDIERNLCEHDIRIPEKEPEERCCVSPE